jgi:pimeloyl-ACP methyl ester carboxylesterase
VDPPNEPAGDPGPAPLQPLAVQESRLGPDVASLEIFTTDGVIVCLRHRGRDPLPDDTTVVFVSGALGGLSGPAGGLYHRVAGATGGVRLHYRRPNDMEACVMDVLLLHHLLARQGVERMVLVGHSFGGAVAIAAGVYLAQAAAGVVALSTQVPGTEQVDLLAGVPLLLIHGDRDGILPDLCSHDVYERAGEPKDLIIVPGEGHLLSGVSDALAARVEDFVRTCLPAHS